MSLCLFYMKEENCSIFFILILDKIIYVYIFFFNDVNNCIPFKDFFFFSMNYILIFFKINFI